MAKIYCDVFGEDIDDSECKDCCIRRRQELDLDEREKCTFHGKITPWEELQKLKEDGGV